MILSSAIRILDWYWKVDYRFIMCYTSRFRYNVRCVEMPLIGFKPNSGILKPSIMVTVTVVFLYDKENNRCICESRRLSHENNQDGNWLYCGANLVLL